MSKSILTGRTIKVLGNENQKLGGLGGQMEDMHNDFLEMKRTRDEARKQMEARFQDVYRKIELAQTFVIQEGKRINDTVIAFTSKFDNKLNNLNQKLDQQLQDMKNDHGNKFKEDRERMKRIESDLEQEKQDRMSSIQDSNKNIGDQLNALSSGLENEKSTRENREKEIERSLADNVYKLNSQLEQEQQDRRSGMQLFKQQMDRALDNQTKLSQNFHQKSISEFEFLVDNLSKEMENRFNHQDKIVDNLSHVVKTIQDTLKVIGSDV